MFKKLFNFFEGKLSQSEKENFLDTIVKSDSDRDKYITVKNFLTLRRIAQAKRNIQKEREILDNLHNLLYIGNVSRKSYLGKVFIISASFIVLIGIVFSSIQITTKIKEREAISYIVAQNKINQENSEVVIELSTGEKVNLNEKDAESKIFAGKLSINSSGNQIQIASVESQAAKTEPKSIKGDSKTAHGNAIKQSKMNTIHIKGKNDYLLTLEDGSKVWLRSNAKFSFPDKFDKSVRNVELNGEAYFDITKDEHKPFIINTGKANVMVLGTQFNLKSKLDEHNLELSMVTGNVAFSVDGLSPVNLSTNEQLNIDLGNLKYTINEIDGYKYKAWTDGYFVFINENLSSILKTLSDWYEIDIELLSPKYNNQEFNGKFKVTSGLDNLIKTLQLSYNFNFYMNGNKIFIK